MSRDYGWTLREVLELTPGEVLLYVDERRPASRMFVSTHEARAIAIATRERRTAWIERVLDGSCDTVACGAWERLTAWSERLLEEASNEPNAMSGDKHEPGSPTMRDGERLRLIYEELQMIRSVLAADKRAWRE